MKFNLFSRRISSRKTSILTLKGNLIKDINNSIKDIEFWMSLYNNLKDVWFLILMPVIITIVKLLNKNDLCQTRNVEKIKPVLKNT